MEGRIGGIEYRVSKQRYNRRMHFEDRSYWVAISAHVGFGIQGLSAGLVPRVRVSGLR